MATKNAMPDYSEMSGAELLTAYNTILSAQGKEPRKAKFKNAAEGVVKCQQAWEEAFPTAEQKKARREEEKAAKEKAKAEEAAKAPEKPAKEAKEPKEAKAKGKGKAEKAEGSTGSRRKATKIVVLASTNPYRTTSAAHAHFERMRKHPTIAGYLDSFPDADRKTANQWLWNAENRGGHIRTE